MVKNRNRLSVGFVALTWIALNAALFAGLLLSPRGPIQRTTQTTLILIQTVLGSISVYLLEVTVVCLALWIISRLSSRWLKAAAVVLLSISCATYIGLFFGSWYKKVMYGAFISSADLKHIYYLFDPASLKIYIQPGHILWGTLIVLLFISSLFFLLKKWTFYSKPNRTVAILTGCSAVICLLIINLIQLSLPSRVKSDLPVMLHNSMAPQGRLAIELLLPEKIKTFEQVELSLIPQDAEYQPARSHTRSETLPDIIIVAIEALRDDVFQKANLPGIKEIEQDGLRFTNAYAQATDTEKSLKTIVTGQFPLRGVTRHSYQESESSLSLFSILKRAGYLTAKLTLFDWLVMLPESLGYSVDLYSDPALDGAALKLKAKLAKEYDIDPNKIDNKRIVPLLDRINLDILFDWLNKTNEPHFALFYIYSTHFPFASAPSDKDSLLEPVTDSVYYFSRADSQQYFARYLKSIEQADTLIQSLLSFIKQREKKTILIVTGDHGEEFYEHGFSLHIGSVFDESIKVPLILYNFPQRCKGTLSDRTVGHIDIAPTILDVLNLKSYPGHQGLSLCKPIPERRLLYGSSQGLVFEDYIIAESHKLIRSLSAGKYRLFDRNKDPQELVDIFDPANPEHLKLKTLLDNYRNKQLTYFTSPREFQVAHFPPRHPLTSD